MNKIMAYKTTDRQKCSKGISKATVYFHRKVKTFVLLEDCVDIFYICMEHFRTGDDSFLGPVAKLDMQRREQICMQARPSQTTELFLGGGITNYCTIVLHNICDKAHSVTFRS